MKNNHKAHALDEEDEVLIRIVIVLSIFSGIGALISSRILLNFSILFNWNILLLLIVILEIFFLLDKSKPNKKDNLIKFTAKRKGVSLIKSILSILGGFTLYNLVKNYWETILKWIGYIGAGALALALIIVIGYYYLRLNSLKYNQHKKEVKN